jgi:AcrR family transcriptional regulator
MTTTTPTRRERLRSATVAEIKASARRLLVDGGAPAISLRAIARDMGMTAPAIYRYFDSLDTLVIALISDYFEEVRVEVEQVGAAHADAGPATRIAAMVRAFRLWSLAHPAEFALMFGSPVPGIAPFAIQCGPLNDAGARFGEAFLSVLADLYAITPFPAPPSDVLDGPLRDTVSPYFATHGEKFPLPVVYAFLSSWTSLYGIVAMEVFGHLQWAVTDVEPLFELELHRAISRLVQDV